MVIGGFHAYRNDDIEELKMNSSLEDGCPVTDRLPVTVDGAVGANMGGDDYVFYRFHLCLATSCLTLRRNTHHMCRRTGG